MSFLNPIGLSLNSSFCQTFPPRSSQLVREVNGTTVNVGSFEPGQYMQLSFLSSFGVLAYLPNASLADMVSVSMLKIIMVPLDLSKQVSIVFGSMSERFVETHLGYLNDN